MKLDLQHPATLMSFLGDYYGPQLVTKKQQIVLTEESAKNNIFEQLELSNPLRYLNCSGLLFRTSKYYQKSAPSICLKTYRAEGTCRLNAGNTQKI